MFAQERQDRIVRGLARQRRCSVETLQRELGVSRSTLQRDLRDLEERGEVVRVHGGVVHPQFVGGESTLGRRRSEHVAAKRRIAEAAAALVPANAAVFLDAGSTCLELALHLLPRDDVKLFTHSVPLLHAALERGSNASVTALGGELRAVSGALVGALAERWLGGLRFDVAFLGGSGLDAEHGVSTTEIHEAGVKTALLSRTRRPMLVCDASKCDAPAAVSFTAWDALDTWVVDRRPPGGFRRVGCTVRVAR